MVALPKPSHVDGRATASRGGVGVGERDAAGAAVDHRHRRRREEAGQLVAVAVLGRAEQPVGGAEALGQGEGAGHVLPGDGPGGVHAAGGRGSRPRGRGWPSRSPAGGSGSKPLGMRRGRDPPFGQLAAAQVVDGDVAPRRVVGRVAGEVGQLGPLPGQVVVVEDRRPAPEGGGHGVGGPGLSGREHRFSTTTRSASARAASRSRGGRRARRRPSPARPPPGRHRRRRRCRCRSRAVQDAGPLPGLDGHPVGGAEPEREEGDQVLSQGGAVPSPAVAGREPVPSRESGPTVRGSGR